MGTHHITHASELRAGDARPLNRTFKGVPVSQLVIESFAPIVADPDAICVQQANAGGALTLNGVSVVSGVAIADVPRNVTVDASDTAAEVVTISGYDVHGMPMKENITLNGTTAVAGVKAFKRVTSVTVAAATTGEVFVGFGAKLGLTYLPKVGGFIRGRLNEDTADAGTFVAPSRVTATATTVDVRGTYAYAGTADGTNVFTLMYIAANDSLGVTQFNG